MKYAEYWKGENVINRGRKKEVRKFEEYVRSLEGQELENFLTEYESKYTEQEKNSEGLQSESIQNDQEMKIEVEEHVKSEISEIPQEEIVMMTCLPNSFSTQVSIESPMKQFGE